MSRLATTDEIPSRHGNRLTYRDGRVTDLDGNPIPSEALAPPPTPPAPATPKAQASSTAKTAPKQPKPSAKRSKTATKSAAKKPAKPTYTPPAPMPQAITHHTDHPTASGRGSAIYGTGAKTYFGPGFDPAAYHTRPGSIVARIIARLLAMPDATAAFIGRAEIISGYNAPRQNWCNYFGRAIAAGQLRYVQDANGVLIGIALPQYRSHHPSAQTTTLADLAASLAALQKTAADLAERLHITQRQIAAYAAMAADTAQAGTADTAH